MSFLQILVLALVQGITEFLPISSSGHLILVPALTGWPDQGLTTDVMVHVGSLAAILVYFRKDVIRVLAGGLDAARRRPTRDARLFWLLAVGTIPAIAVGLALKASGALDALRADATLKVEVVAWNAIVFGIVLYIADRVGRRIVTAETMGFGAAIVIGCAQAIALVPGVSRSGITMSAARFLGFDRVEAARFSFLLGVPAIAAAGILTLLEVIESGAGIGADALLAAVLTFFSALAAIAFLMAAIKRFGFLPYTLYRIALGIILLWMFVPGS